jgi:hypothetical protein
LPGLSVASLATAGSNLDPPDVRVFSLAFAIVVAFGELAMPFDLLIYVSNLLQVSVV